MRERLLFVPIVVHKATTRAKEYGEWLMEKSYTTSVASTCYHRYSCPVVWCSQSLSSDKDALFSSIPESVIKCIRTRISSFIDNISNSYDFVRITRERSYVLFREIPNLDSAITTICFPRSDNNVQTGGFVLILSIMLLTKRRFEDVFLL